MKKKGWIYWIPRILSIVFILLLMLFSLDVFGEGLSFWQTVLGLLIHKVPAFVLLAVLIISWKYEMAGGNRFYPGGNVVYLFDFKKAI